MKVTFNFIKRMSKLFNSKDYKIPTIINDYKLNLPKIEIDSSNNNFDKILDLKKPSRSSTMYPNISSTTMSYNFPKMIHKHKFNTFSSNKELDQDRELKKLGTEYLGLSIKSLPLSQRIALITASATLIGAFVAACGVGVATMSYLREKSKQEKKEELQQENERKVKEEEKKKEKDLEIKEQKKQELDKIDDILSKLSKITKENNRDHATSEGVEKNKKAIIYQKIKLMFDQIKNDDNLISYFKGEDNISGKKVDLDSLLQLLYYCNLSLADQMYSGHKPNLDTLDFVEDLIERHINRNINKNKIKLFELIEQKPSDVYKTLQNYGELLKIYTVSIYLRGRSFIYDGTFLEGESYFEISRYLGKRLGLLEGHLSDRSGIGIINDYKIEQAIKNGDNDRVTKLINKNIKMYKELMSYKKKYIRDYKPGGEFEEIVPVEDSINYFECSKRIMKYYTKQIILSDKTYNHSRKIDGIIQLLEGNDKYSGVLDILNNQNDNSKYKDNKKISMSNQHKASLYNYLGEMLYELYNKNLNINKLCKTIGDKLEFTNNAINPSDLIKSMFNKAGSLSNDFSYTKANAEKGLAKVEYSELKNNKNISDIDTMKAIYSILSHISTVKDINDGLKESYDGIQSTSKEILKKIKLNSLDNKQLLEENIEQYEEIQDMIDEIW